MARSHQALTIVLAALAAGACDHGQAGDSFKKPVSVTFTPTAPGPIRYACAMDMVAGELVAE